MGAACSGQGEGGWGARWPALHARALAPTPSAPPCPALPRPAPPCRPDLHVIIFDEIDAICKSRGSVRDGSGVHDTIVNQLLTKIDGVDALNNILLIGMTNRCACCAALCLMCFAVAVLRRESRGRQPGWHLSPPAR